MTHTATGIVHGNTIVLTEPLAVLEGQQVEVVVRPTRGDDAEEVAAFWTPEDDRILAEIQAARKLSRTGEHPLSSQRPMSPEERAELERVYQDRGCGVECDP